MDLFWLFFILYHTSTALQFLVFVKVAAEKIFEALGINMSTAVNIFLRQTIRENGIPFELKLKTPNETTALAIEEGRTIAKDESVKGYDNMDALKAALYIQ